MSPPYFYSNMKTFDILKNSYQKHSIDYGGWIIYQEQQNDLEIVKSGNQKKGVTGV